MSAQLFCPGIFVTLIKRSDSNFWIHSVGVAMWRMRPAPLRNTIPRPADASVRISNTGEAPARIRDSRQGLFNVPDASDGVSLANRTPKSRIKFTNPMPNEVAFTMEQNSDSALLNAITVCVFDVERNKWLPWNALTDDVERRVLKQPAWSLCE